MPRSSRHRSHKQSKHSSKDYSDSEEDVRMKDKSSRDENLVKAYRDSSTGEKRKVSSQAREFKESKDPNGCGNGEASEEYFSSKRRKEKTDIGDGGDRWNGGGEERGNSDRIVKETIKGDNFKSESKLKEISNRGESSRMEWKNKDKKYGSGSAGDMESSAVVVEKEDNRSKGGESKRKSERGYSGQKEGKEIKGKDRRADKEKEKNLGQVSKRGDAETNLVDMDVGKKQELQSGDLGVERKVKRRENSDFPVKEELQNPESEKEVDKRIRRRRESSSDRDKHHDDFKEGDERGLSSRSDCAKDVKYKDDKPKDRIYADKYHKDDHKNDGQRDEKYHEEMKNDNKHRDGKLKEDIEKDAKRRDDRNRGDGDRDDRHRDDRHKDEKHREDGEKDTKRKDDKHREVVGRRRDHSHREDSERESRRRDDRYRDNGEKNDRHGDIRHYENGDRDDRHQENNYREDTRRDNITKEERHREDIERDSRYKDGKQADDFDIEKRPREAKYSEELAPRDCSGDKSEPRHSIDGGYAADRRSKHSSTHDDSPIHDDRAVRYRDDQGRRRTNEKQDNSDVKSRSTKDQRFDAEKKSGSDAQMDSVPDRGRSTSRIADIELNLSHSRQRSSPGSSSLAPRDNYRLPKPDEYKHREYSYEEKLRHNMTSGRDYAMGGSEKTSSWAQEKLGQKEDGHLRESSGERRLKSDIRSSPLKLLDKSPSSNTDRRQFNRSDVRRNIDIEELTQRSSGSRDVKDHTGKEGRERRELAMDILPRDEHSLADADTLSVSSPFTRNSHLSGSSKSYPPLPPLRTGVDSPLMLGSIEDDSRFKSNSRHRRSGDPNLGRIQGNLWRGVPSWPSTVPNGFMSFPHPPPPVSFHSVMQPFPAPPMFGIRPSVDSNHLAPYHISDTDRFSGPVRPVGWHSPVDDSCPPFHSWDARNTVFRDEAHSYGRPRWDHSRSLPGGRGWDTTGDLWKGPSNTACLEMPCDNKENDFSLNVDEALAGQSIQPTQNEQIFPDEQAATADANQSTYDSEINSADAPINNLEDTSNFAKISKKDDVPLCLVYLSKLDISADLTEPELFNQCRGFIEMDQSIISDVDDLKILFIEEAIEAKIAPHQILRSSLSATMDDSVFQKAISLYESQNSSFDKVINREKFSIANLPFTKSDHEDLNIEDNKTEKPSTTSDMQDEEDAVPNVNVELTPPYTSSYAEGYTEFAHQNLDLPPADTVVKSEEPVSTTEHDNVLVNLASKLLPKDQIIEERPLSVESIEGFHAPLPAEVKNDGNIEEVKLGVTSYGILLNSDVCSEAMTPELVVSESIIFSRIHHSPESTH